MKATNKSNHLKLIGRHALSKIFKKSKFIFGKIAVGKKQSAILVKKGTFHWKANTKDR